MIIGLVASAVAVHETCELALWSAMGGGGISIFLVLYVFYRLFPGRRVLS